MTLGEAQEPLAASDQLFQGPPTLGWEFISPATKPFDESCPEQLRRREVQAELLRLDAEEGRIAAMRRQLAGPRVDANRFYWSLGATVFSFLFVSLGGIFVFVFVVSVCALVYAWPYFNLRDERRQVAEYDGLRRRIEYDLRSVESRLDKLRAEHASAEAEHLARYSKWLPLSPDGRARLEVFGGTKVGWEAFVLTFGSSLLGSSARLFVLDLTERHVATHLARLAVDTGRDVRYVALPEQAGGLDLFAELSTRELVECLVAAWHDAESDVQARTDLARDAFVLEQISGCLDGDPVTLPRLSAAVNALLRLETPARGSAVSLTEQEQVRLERLFGERVSSSVQFTDRLLALAGFLRQLNSDSSVEQPIVSLARLDADLTLLETTAQGHSLDKTALAAVIVQVLQRQHTRQRDRDAVPTDLFLVGADSIGRGALERLSRFAEDAGVRFTVFFQSLRSPGADIIGTGGAMQLFMRLGHRKDAEQAAEQLGRQHKFVLSQLSSMEGDSISETYGEQVSKSRGSSLGMMTVNIGRVPLLIPSVSTNQGTQNGTSWGKQTGKSRQDSRTQNRVYEHLVEPEVLQRLGQYTFVYRSGPDRVTAGDCDPEIAYSPQVDREKRRPTETVRRILSRPALLPRGQDSRRPTD